MKHTPGPWTTEAVSDAVRIIARVPSRDGMSRRPRGVKIILARLAPPQLPEAETHANARLMAAAPDLLEACQKQHDALDLLLAMLAERDRNFFPSESAAWPAILAGNAAIAKAEGKS